MVSLKWAGSTRIKVFIMYTWQIVLWFSKNFWFPNFPYLKTFTKIPANVNTQMATSLSDYIIEFLISWSFFISTFAPGWRCSSFLSSLVPGAIACCLCALQLYQVSHTNTKNLHCLILQPVVCFHEISEVRRTVFIQHFYDAWIEASSKCTVLMTSCILLYVTSLIRSTRSCTCGASCSNVRWLPPCPKIFLIYYIVRITSRKITERTHFTPGGFSISSWLSGLSQRKKWPAVWKISSSIGTVNSN